MKKNTLICPRLAVVGKTQVKASVCWDFGVFSHRLVTCWGVRFSVVLVGLTLSSWCGV